MNGDLFESLYKIPPVKPDNPDLEQIKKYIETLTEFLKYHQHLYYIKNEPIISDKSFDEKLKELKELENQFPQFTLPDSPTRMIGSDIEQEFPKFKHKIPVLSLTNTYTINEALEWAYKTGANKFNVQWKVDGLTLVLYYMEGQLKHAVTRGTGDIGDEITENALTIRTIPYKLKKKINLIIRGEAYMNYSDFEKFNEEVGSIYANPRNLTSGSIKQKKSSEVAKRPLRWIAFDGYLENTQIQTDEEMLKYMDNLGLPVFEDNETVEISQLEEVIKKFEKKLKTMDIPVDGLVIKVDNRILREELGYTSHSPKWAIAFKFEPDLAKTIIEDIEIQVGRTGRITPRAKLKEVQLAGTKVSFATLHNEDFIKKMGIKIGSEVIVSKRGDIIPAVEEVVNPGNGPEYVFPEFCPSCNSKLYKENSNWFCKNNECNEKLIQQLIFFCGRKQMDISGLGEKTIRTLFQKGFIRYIEDIYELDKYKEQMVNLENFGEKSVNIILKGIEESKTRDFKRIFVSLGLKEIGPNVVDLLIENGYDNIDKILNLVRQNEARETLTQIYGIGEETAGEILSQFTDPVILKRIEKLKKHLNFSHAEEKTVLPQIFYGQIWCVTGTFENFKPREKAIEEIKKRGGKISSSVTKQTTYLLKGKNPGSKIEKAEKLKIKIISEEEFLNLINSY